MLTFIKFAWVWFLGRPRWQQILIAVALLAVLVVALALAWKLVALVLTFVGSILGINALTNKTAAKVVQADVEYQQTVAKVDAQAGMKLAAIDQQQADQQVQREKATTAKIDALPDDALLREGQAAKDAYKESHP